MSLPSPNLDNRKFQDIVDDAKRKLGRRCPEWSDHNVSDPGVTLIELFAWMTETMLYQLNQVPEKNYVKFLEMLGITLDPPAPARTELRFRLSTPIPNDGAETVDLPPRTTAGTMRTETEEAVEFSTDARLLMAAPSLRHVLSLPAATAPEKEESLPGLTELNPEKTPFSIFSAHPVEGDALYLGFEGAISNNVVQLGVDCIPATAVMLADDYPSQKWEYWNGNEDPPRWDLLEPPDDTSYGFNHSRGGTRLGRRTGFIEIAMPGALQKKTVAGRTAYWIRCVYTTELPPRGPDRMLPAKYDQSPKILKLDASVVGGTALATNCRTVEMRDLGQSDATPGQVFYLGRSPILALNKDETVVVGPRGITLEQAAALPAWKRVPDFAESKPDDRHFTCDTYAGTVTFGPSVRQTDGTARQYGAVPEKGATVYFTRYRHGGGVSGNIAPGQVVVMKESRAYITSVTNIRRAIGGREQETLELAKMRAQQMLRQQGRAVTAEDFEFLALKSSSGVGRARCVQPTRAVHSRGVDGMSIPPGVVRLLLIPALNRTVRVPRITDLMVPEATRSDVIQALDEARLLTTVLEVDQPEYVFVSTDITVIAEAKSNPDVVRQDVRARLEDYLHPLWGGPGENGWPFRRTLTLADIYAQVQSVPGVAFLREAPRVFQSTVANWETGQLKDEAPVSLREGLKLGENAMLCTREHRVVVRPFWDVGLEEA